MIHQICNAKDSWLNSENVIWYPSKFSVSMFELIRKWVDKSFQWTYEHSQLLFSVLHLSDFVFSLKRDRVMFQASQSSNSIHSKSLPEKCWFLFCSKFQLFPNWLFHSCCLYQEHCCHYKHRIFKIKYQNQIDLIGSFSIFSDYWTSLS